MKLFGPDPHANAAVWIALAAFALSISNLAMNLVALNIIHH